jgi:hypothetical protein
VLDARIILFRHKGNTPFDISVNRLEFSRLGRLEPHGFPARRVPEREAESVQRLPG